MFALKIHKKKHWGCQCVMTCDHAKILTAVTLFLKNFFIIEIQKHLSWKWHLRSLNPSTKPALPSPPPNRVPKWHIYMSFKYFQAWWLRYFRNILTDITRCFIALLTSRWQHKLLMYFRTLLNWGHGNEKSRNWVYDEMLYLKGETI